MDDMYRQYQRSGRARNSSTVIAAGATDTVLTTLLAAYTIYVQTIIVTFYTSTANAWLFQDTGGLYVANIPASPILHAPYTFDFGPKGKPLTSALSLEVSMSAGNAGHIEVMSYLKAN